MTFSNKLFPPSCGPLVLGALLMSGVWGFSSTAHANDLYQCTLGANSASYHVDEVPRMKSLGATCRLLGAAEKVLCSVGSVQSYFAADEALAVLETSPRASCAVAGRLYVGNVTASSIGISASSSTSTSTTVVQETQTVIEQTSESTIAAFSSKPSMGIVAQSVLYFSLGRSKLPKSELPKLIAFADKYGNGQHMITITGHTDASGSARHNHLLSLKRAGTARDLLIDVGMDPNYIFSVNALGEESLRQRTRNGVRLRFNRAVELRAYR